MTQISVRILLPFLLLSPITQAEVIRIPTESGWSGAIGFGLGYSQYSSNLTAGTRFSKLGSDTVSSIQSEPESSHKLNGNPYFDIRYTFAEQRGQLFLGNLLQDAVRLDLAQQIGYRQELKDNGIVSASLVFSGLPIDVWQDSYQEGSPRQETKRSSNGFRLDWDSIAGSQASTSYTYRKVSLDQDLNGTWAVENDLIDASQQKDLQRGGELHQFEMSYNVLAGKGRFFIPAIKYTQRNLDGAAMAGHSYGLQLTYASFHQSFSTIINGYWGQRIHDQDNPIYQQKTDSTEWALNANLFYHSPFGLNGWDLVSSASYAIANSAVDFHDVAAKSLRFNLLYRF